MLEKKYPRYRIKDLKKETNPRYRVRAYNAIKILFCEMTVNSNLFFMGAPKTKGGFSVKEKR
jgi:hypothetical protein